MALDDQRKSNFKFVGTRPNRPDGMDKVTGRAKFGADMYAPGMLHGAILRSPHAHARITKLDVSRAEKLKGVKAIVTRADFSKKISFTPGKDLETWNVLENIMAGEKVLYDGHAVAAVAATSALAARDAVKLIDVEYEILPHVTDVDAAMAEDAPVVREGVADKSVPKGLNSNIARYHESGHGDVEVGFKEADLIVEDSFKTEATHQGYIEPHACLATLGNDGKGELWCTTQGHFYFQKICAALLDLETSQLRVTASEIGGGFGGKTTVFVEPVALALSRKANRPVKLVMSRSEVFRATGPTSSTSMDIKIGMKKDGTITAGQGTFRLQGGAFPGAPGDLTAMCAFAPPCLDVVLYGNAPNTYGWTFACVLGLAGAVRGACAIVVVSRFSSLMGAGAMCAVDTLCSAVAPAGARLARSANHTRAWIIVPISGGASVELARSANHTRA